MLHRALQPYCLVRRPHLDNNLALWLSMVHGEVCTPRRPAELRKNIVVNVLAAQEEA